VNNPLMAMVRAMGLSQASTAWVTIDDILHQGGELLTCTYSTDSRQVGHETKAEPRNDKAVLLTAPAAGFVIYE
jgi:hypothetical protein